MGAYDYPIQNKNDLVTPVDPEVAAGFAKDPNAFQENVAPVDPSYYQDAVLPPIAMPGSQRVLGDLGAGNQLAQNAPVQLETPVVEAPQVQPQAPMSTTDQAFQLNADAIKEQYLQGQKRAAAVAGFQAGQAKQDRIEIDNQAKQMDERNKILSDRLRQFDETKAELANTKFENPWFRQSAGRQIASAIAIGLGAYGEGMGGGPNVALKIITSQMDKDAEDQVNNYKAKQGGLESQNKAIDNIRGIFKDEDSQKLALKSMRADAAIRSLEGINAKFDGLAETPKYQALMSGLMLKKQEYDIDLAKKQADTLKAQQEAVGINKPLTADQSKASGFAARMQQAENDFTELNNLGFDRSSRFTAIGKALLPESFETDLQKRQDQAERNFLTSVLRRESGAAISDSERDIGEKQYFPRAGDGADVIAQKQRNRQLVQQSIALEGGGKSGIQVPNSNVRTYPNGAQFRIENGQAIPLNESAIQIQKEIEAKKGKE